MELTKTQATTLKDHISNNTDAIVSDALLNKKYWVIADWYNNRSSIYVWRTSITERDITLRTSEDNTKWSWSDYIIRTMDEKIAWARLMGDTCTIDPSMGQVRQAVADIFSGLTGDNQRAHLLAIFKRKATIAESLFITGTGSKADPGFLTIEGGLSYDDIERVIQRG